MDGKKDKETFGKLMIVLQEVFVPDKNVSKGKTELYFRMLKHLDIEDITIACEGIIKSRRFPIFPLPAEIMEGIEMSDKEQVKHRAMVGWGSACDEVYQGTHDPDDPVVSEAVRLAFGSWHAFGKTDPKNESFDRRRFIESYEIAHKQQVALPPSKILKELVGVQEKIKKLKA